MAKKKSEAQIIGENIRRIREEKHLSQKEVAAAIDVAATQYGRVELGKVVPALKSLIKIAKTLGVPLDTLVSESETPTQEVSIKDKSLMDKVKLIDELPEQEKNMILQVLDLALSKKKFKDLVQQFG